MLPTHSITLEHDTLIAGEATRITITFFDESTNDLKVGDLQSLDGSFSELQSANGGTSWSALFTPHQGVSTTTSVITLDGSVFGGASSAPFTIDTLRPTATIAVGDNALTTNETALVTITFSEPVQDFVPADLSADNGSLDNLSSSDGGKTWTAEFTPTAGVFDANNAISLNPKLVRDMLGNTGVDTVVSSNNYSVNTVVPTAPTATIVVEGSPLKSGAETTVVITFSERVDGFDLADIMFDGSMHALTTSDNGVTWTAKLRPNDNIESSENVVMVNLAGVTGHASQLAGSGYAASNKYTIDTRAPAATILIDDSLLTTGETAQVTITFSEAVTGLELADLSARSGALSKLATDNNITWTATFTPSPGDYTFNNYISLGSGSVVDAAGNHNVNTAYSNNYYVHTGSTTPTVTISVDDTALKAGEGATVTFAFSQNVDQSFDSGDVSVGSGKLSAIARVGSTNTYTAILTPDDDVETGNNVVSVDMTGVTGYNTEVSGVGTATSQAYSVDTRAPTAAVTLANTTLNANQTSTLSIVFSEAVEGLDIEDFTVEGGRLSNLVSSDEGAGARWSATFTPTLGLEDDDLHITLNNSGVRDLAGNAGVGLTQSNAYAIDADAPTAIISISDSTIGKHETATVTIRFSEYLGELGQGRVSAENGMLSAFGSVDEGLTWTATFTPNADVQNGYNKLSFNSAGLSDAAGNAVFVTNPGYYTVDTRAPTATVVVADGTLTAGETSAVTITFSEAIQSFDPALIRAENATLGALATNDGITWTTTLTPKGNVSDASNVVSVQLEQIADLAGNTGSGVATSNNYTVDTAPPVVVVPTPPVMVDGVAIKKTSGTAADGSRTQVITVPTVAGGRVDKDGNAALADIPLVKSSGGDALLSVGVPVGFGVKASGSITAKAASDSLTNLIAEIKAHSTKGSAQESMVGGGSGFLGMLDKAPLLVQTIVVSASGSTDLSKGAFVISGNAGAGSPQTALVIDARDLPPGATIELQNVDFAAIMGAVTLRGGEGKQTIFGDGASQDILLGDGDDILHGGAGNDIVGSAGGNDQIFGDEGDDIVFGGEGNDIIDGGAGYDIVKLAGASRAEYSFRVDDGKLVMTHLNGGSDGADIVSNVEALRFTGASGDVAFRDTDVASLVRMYETAFDRNADEGGLNFWIGRSEAGVSLHDIAEAMVTSSEAQVHFKGMSDAAFIQALYLQGLERAGTAQEAKVWIDALESGAVSRGDALLGFADSAEKIALVGFMDTSITTA